MPSRCNMYKLWQTYKTSYLLFVLFLLQIQNWHFRCINSNTRCDLREWKYLKRAIQHDIFKHRRFVAKMALSRWSMTHYFDAIYIKHAFWYLKKLSRSNYCNQHVIHAAEFISFIVYIYTYLFDRNLIAQVVFYIWTKSYQVDSQTTALCLYTKMQTILK